MTQALSPASPRGLAPGGKPKRHFWRREDPSLEAGTKRVLKGGMWEHQRRWWDLPNFLRLFVGGYGSGKTMILMKRMIGLSLINAPYPVAVVSPTFPVARETTIATGVELLEGKEKLLGRDRFRFTYNKSTHVFHIYYGRRKARLIILTGEVPQNLKGFNLAAAGIDEPFIQAEEVFKQMVARVRAAGAVRREINMTGTPEELNWGYDLAMGEYDEKYDLGLVQASSVENRALPDDFVPRLYAMYDEQAAKAFVEGQFVSLGGGLVYYGFNPKENIVPLGPPQPGVELGCGMDFNVNPMAATVFWRQGNHMHFFDEIELPNSDTEQMCHELHERGYYDMGLRNVYPDASGRQRHSNAPGGKTDFYFIEKAGFKVNCNPQNPAIRDRYNSVNGKLKPRDGKVTLTFEPYTENRGRGRPFGCKSLRKYLSVYAHKHINKEEQKAMSHLLDAMGYPVAYCFPASRETATKIRLRGV